MCLRSFMRSRAWCFAATLLILSPLAAQYRTALPGYRYEFPRDHFNHPDYQTEWWYYTGNLKSADGHRYGFELTFFRQAVRRDGHRLGPAGSLPRASGVERPRWREVLPHGAR